ncbi:MAG: putative toxin-antitoxin system toxin component, PIN family [Candidatus Aminicenantes bacterium]|nr:putative toxin-antitoxin system toxin component, PIN family [Candidatus Aminicenantes bacterium]
MSGRRVVFDTNVFLSAFTFGGKPEIAFEMARAGRIQLIVSTPILGELAAILKSKFAWDDEDIREALRVVGRHAELVKPGMRLRVLREDADNRVLECALAGQANWIISGDRHLLSLKEFRGILIVRVSDFLSDPT